MSNRTTLKCPSCSLRMTVESPTVRSKLICPSCQQRILLIPGKPPQKQTGSLADFEALPPMVILSTPVAGPVNDKRVLERAARRKHAAANRDSIQAARRKRIRQITPLVVVAVLTIAIACTVVWYVRSIPRESWATAIPGMQTPAKLVREYQGICDAFQESCESIDSEFSRDRAIQTISVLSARLRGFPARVEEFGPLTAQQRESFQPDWPRVVDEEETQSQEWVRVLRGKRMLLSGEFLTTLQKHLNALEQASQSMKTAWNTNERR